MFKDKVVKFYKERKGEGKWKERGVTEETSRVEHGRSKRERRLHNRYKEEKGRELQRVIQSRHDLYLFQLVLYMMNYQLHGNLVFCPSGHDNVC